MNIFFVDKDPREAAKALCNAHVRSQIRESMQMLSVAHFYYGLDDDKFEKVTHKNHPCTKWVMASRDNYKWLVKHLTQLLIEYKTRHGNSHHKEELLRLYENVPEGLPYSYGHNMTVPPAVVSEDLKPQGTLTFNGVVDAYRQYYNRDKRHLHFWMVTSPPVWIIDDETYATIQAFSKALYEGRTPDGTTHP